MRLLGTLLHRVKLRSRGDQIGAQNLPRHRLRENLVRLDGLPLVVRVPSVPDIAAGTRVRLAVKSVDLLERVIDCTYRETLPGSGAALAETAADAGEKA